MKRFLFWFLLTIVALGWVHGLHRFRGQEVRMQHEEARYGNSRRPGPPETRDSRFVRVYSSDRGRKVVEIIADDDRDDAIEFDRDPPRREPAEGLPVEIVPGSRTTEARVEPPRPARRKRASPPVRPVSPARVETGPPAQLTVTGLRSATEERARDSARAQLETLLAERLGPRIPANWKVPPGMVDSMIREVSVKPIERDYGTVYEATIKAELSPETRVEIVETYRRQQVMSRLAVFGALLGFVLVCLAALSAYIKTDEATKGYYTTRLRLAAAAAAGAAGVTLYRWLV